MTPPFQTAIIDPPWPYHKVSENRKLKGFVAGRDSKKQYSTLSIEDLCSLPISSVVSKYVFLWTVGPFLREGLRCLDAWGFDYVTSLAWHKNTGYGVGYWFRGDHELVLIGKRKGAPSIRTNERSLFASSRGRHSAKPPRIHEIVERHFPGPWLELFGRQARGGWTVLGNEAPGDGGEIRESLNRFIPQ